MISCAELGTVESDAYASAASRSSNFLTELIEDLDAGEFDPEPFLGHFCTAIDTMPPYTGIPDSNMEIAVAPICSSGTTFILCYEVVAVSPTNPCEALLFIDLT